MQTPYYLGVEQHREPVPAVDREDHRRADHDAGHHQRRDRPVGRVGDGARRRASSPSCSSMAVPMPLALLAALLAGLCRWPVQRLLGRVRRPAVAGGDACRTDRLPRRRADPARGPRDRRISGLVQCARSAAAPRAGDAFDHHLRRSFRGRSPIALHSSALRPPHLRHRQQPGGGPLFRRAGPAGEDDAVRRFRRRSRRSPACSIPRASARCAATWRPASSSTSSRWCCSVASAFSAVRETSRASVCRSWSS